MRTRRILLLVLCLCGTPASDACSGEVRRERVGRIRVPGDGFVQVTTAALRRLGVEHASHAEVTRRGQPVPICAASEVDGVVFLARGTATPLSRVATYELWHREQANSGIPQLAVEAVAPDVPVSVVPVTRRAQEDRFFAQLQVSWQDADPPPAPTWFLTPIQPGGEVQLDVDLRRAVGEQRIAVRVFTSHRSPVRVYAELDSDRLGIERAPGGAYGGVWFTWSVEGPKASKGGRLLLKDRTELPPDPRGLGLTRRRGWVWVDEVRIDGDVEAEIAAPVRAYPMPEAGALVLRVERPVAPAAPRERVAWAVQLDADGRVLGAARVELDASEPAPLRVRSAGEMGVLHTATQVRVLEPERAAPAVDPVASVRAARHVIVAVPQLLAAAQRLARYRTGRGLPSAAVDVTTLYDAYSHGEQDPEAIRAFVRRLRERAGAPLEYLVLAGDGTHDRTDASALPTIPALMTRTQYNGATPSDWHYVIDTDADRSGAPAVGRLPFRRAAELTSYVDRVIAYETRPPTGPERRLMRFFAGRSNMGAQLDRYFELAFSRVLQQAVPLAMDVEVTYANERSPWYWPLEELSRKIVEDINQGALYVTYVGHGYFEGYVEEQAWDMMARVFELQDARAVAIRGTPPVFIVFACSTTAFDLLHGPCIGEVLLSAPAGPLAYYGASRVCHPAFNTLMGRALAIAAGQGGAARIGEVIQQAMRETLAPTTPDGRTWRRTVEGFTRIVPAPEVRTLDLDLAVRDGLAMYQLLGDPALRVAAPYDDLRVEVALSEDGDEAQVVVHADLPDGLEVHVTLERERASNPPGVEPVADPIRRARYAEVRQRHRMANNTVLAASTGVLADGSVSLRMDVPQEGRGGARIVKAWTVRGTDMHMGARVVPEDR